MGRVTPSSSGSSSVNTPQQVGLRGDAHFEDIAHASWWRMAALLPRTLAAATRLGWAADRSAMLWLAGCRLAVVASSAVALAALPAALAQLFQSGQVAERVAAAAPALIVVAAATGVRAGADALAVYASARLAPEVATEADLQILAAAPRVELEAYDRPGFADRLQAAGRGAEATENLIGDTQALVAALGQLIAAASVLALLHPVLLPLLVLAVVPKGAAAVTTARIQHRADHQNIADTHLRYLLRHYATHQRTAAEVRATTMAAFLADWYQEITDRDQHGSCQLDLREECGVLQRELHHCRLQQRPLRGRHGVERRYRVLRHPRRRVPGGGRVWRRVGHGGFHDLSGDGARRHHARALGHLLQRLEQRQSGRGHRCLHSALRGQGLDRGLQRRVQRPRVATPTAQLVGEGATAIVVVRDDLDAAHRSPSSPKSSV